LSLFVAFTKIVATRYGWSYRNFRRTITAKRFQLRHP